MKDNYTILLVDDEAAMRETLKRMTPWEDYGFEVINEAENGLEALDCIEEKIPDLIITDIRMPYLDGLDLIKIIKDKYPSIMIIIFSGYDEFSFAQDALRYDVAEYILKPISLENMKEILARAKRKLDEEKAEKNDKIKFTAFYQEALPILKEKYFISLLTPVHVFSDEILIEKGKEFGLDIAADKYSIAVLEPNNTDLINTISMKETIDEWFEKQQDAPITFVFENQIVFIFLSKTEAESEAIFKKKMHRTLGQLLLQLKRFYTKELKIGVGNIESAPSSLSLSYKDAIDALNYTILYPDQSIISIYDVEKQSLPSSDAQQTNSLKSDLSLAVKLGSKEDVVKCINALVATPAALQNTFNIPLEVLLMLSEILSTYEASLNDITEDNIYNELSSLNTLSKIHSWVSNICLKAHSLIKGTRKNSHIKFVENAKKVIYENYQNPLFGLDDVCEKIYVSPAYFSTTFKKETGQSFVQYLTNTRLEKAKELLKNTDDKTYQIAEQVGFSEQNYFSFCFKKNVGLSPSQYRQKVR